MTITALAPDMRDLSDDELRDAYVADSDDDVTRAAVLAECARRDRLDRLARGRETLARIRAEWRISAHAAYLLADQDCRGELLSKAGKRAGVRDELALWRLPEPIAMRYASEELREHWEIHPRVTLQDYMRQHAAAARDAQQAAPFGEPADDTETTDETDAWETNDGQGTEDCEDHHAATVVGNEAPAVRRRGERPAAEPVLRGVAGRDGGPVQPAGRPAMISFDQVAPCETFLLARRPYLPYGEVSLVYGEGSLGKGRMVQSIIAAVTNGEPVGLDETTDDDAGDVIVILPEDKRAESAVKRLMAAGANLSRTWDLTRTANGERFKLSATPRHPGHLPELRAAVEQLRADGRNPCLVVIDPIGACIGEGSILTSKGARHLIESLQDFAEATGMCVLVVAHPVSGGKLQGSWALQQALRSVFYASRDESNPDLRLLTNVKGNDIPPELAAPIAFTITDGPRGPRAEWIAPGRAPAGRVRAGRPDWRDELAAKRARKAATAPARTAPTAMPARPAARPGTTYTVTVAANGATRILARGVADLGFAKSMCAATPEAKALERAGLPLHWQQASPGAWSAGNRSVGFAIAAENAGRATA